MVIRSPLIGFSMTRWLAMTTSSLDADRKARST
jgi:hypothetical protein